MEFGIHIGTRGCMARRDNMMAVAGAAEAKGYGIIGVADHLIMPATPDARYPYTADGIWPGAPTGECFDAIATLAFLAGCTQRIKLLTSVVVVPHRPADTGGEIVPDRGRAVRRPGHRRRRRRLDEGRVRRAGHAAVRRTRRGDRRIYPGLEDAVDPGPAVDARQIRPVRQRAVRAEAGVEAASADLGRRRKRACAAPRGATMAMPGIRSPTMPRSC